MDCALPELPRRPHRPPLLRAARTGEWRPRGPSSLRSRRRSLRLRRLICPSRSLQVREELRSCRDQQAACMPSDLEPRGGGTQSRSPGSRPYHTGSQPSLPVSEHPAPGTVPTGDLTAGAPQDSVHRMLGLGTTPFLWGNAVGQVASPPPPTEACLGLERGQGRDRSPQETGRLTTGHQSSVQKGSRIV